MSYYPSKTEFNSNVCHFTLDLDSVSEWVSFRLFSQKCRIIIFGNPHKNPHKILIEMAAFLCGIKRSLAFLRISSISYFLDKV